MASQFCDCFYINIPKLIKYFYLDLYKKALTLYKFLSIAAFQQSFVQSFLNA